MEAAFCITSYPSSSISLPTTKSSLLFNSNRSSSNNFSYSSSLTLPKPHLSCFRNTSPTLSSIYNASASGARRSRYVFYPTTCSFDGRVSPRKEKDNNGDDEKSSRVTAEATVVYLACTMLGIILLASMNKMDGSNPSTNFRTKRNKCSDLPDLESSKPFNINKIKEDVMQMANEEGVNKAIRKLKSLYERNKDDLQKAYLIEMLVVPMLMLQGKYKEALSCKCLSKENNFMNDRRIYTYKTIIYLMTYDYDRANCCFEKLVKRFDPQQRQQLEGQSPKKQAMCEQEDEQDMLEQEDEEDMSNEQEDGEDMSEQEDED